MRQLFVVGLLATCIFNPLRLIPIVAAPDDAAADSDDEKQRQAAERFLVVLEKTPRRGTALDRLYGYHVEAGTLDQFVKTFEDRTARNAKDGAAWMILGLIESQRGRDAAAVTAFTQASKTLPDNPLAAFYLGQSLVLVGQPEEAAAAFEQAISRKPARADLLDMFQALGRVYQRAQKSDQALAVWSRLEKLFPDDLRVQEQIATTLVEEGQHAQALPRFEALAAKVKDEYREATYRIEAADLKVRLGQSKDALADFEKLLSKLNPDNWLYRDVRRRIDDVFLRTDDQTGLAAYYEGWVGKNQEDVDAMGRLARILAGLGRTPEAQTWLDKALKLAPSRKDLRLALIEQLLTEKQFGKAIQQYELLAKNDPNNPDTLRDWGQLILKDTSKPEAERKQAAAAVWRRLVEARPKDSLTATQVADLFRQSEMVDEALALYKKAIELSPDAAQYREYLGEYYHTLKRSDEALAVWREIVAGKNHKAENLARLAEVLAGFGYLPEGVGYILEACKLDNDEFKYPLKAAELLSRSEKYDEALKQLDAADKLADSPENSELVLQQRIRNLQLADKLEAQIEALQKDVASGKNAKEPVRWYLLARYLESARKLPEADQAIAKALALDAKSISYRTAAARIGEVAGNLQGAADAYRTLSKIDRRFQTGHLTQVARLEAQLGRADRALEAGRELLAIASGNPEHYEFYSQLCFRLGKIDEGLDALRRSARLNPAEPKTLLTLAAALAEQFRTDEAIELYWRAFEKSPALDGKLAVISRLAELHLQTNHFDRLIDRLGRLRRESQTQREMTICLAQAHQSAGDYGSARHQLELLLTENARDIQLLQQLGNLAESESDLPATIKYQQQLNAVAGGKENQLRLAQLLSRAGESDAAAAIWGQLAATETDPVAILVPVDSLLAQGKHDVVLAILERLIRDQPRNWELLYRDGAALGIERADEAARRFRAILALNLPDDERSVQSKARQQAAAGGPIGPGQSAQGQAAFRQPLIARFAGASMQQRSRQSGQIRNLAGLDGRGDSWGSGYGQSGRPNFWTPSDFGQARMAALGWLLRLAQKADRAAEFTGELRAAAHKPDPESRALWDWYYLQLIQNEHKAAYETTWRLSRTGDIVAEWLLLASLSDRPESGRSRRVNASRRNRSDKTPPLADDELDHVLACLASIRQKRPDLLTAQGPGSQIIHHVLTELKRADRLDAEAALYRQIVAAADRLETWSLGLELAASRGEFDTAIAQFDKVAAALDDAGPGNQSAAALDEAASAVSMLMAERGKKAAHTDILVLLDRYLACAARLARGPTIAKSARAGSGGRAHATVWSGNSRRSEQFDYPVPNPYYDQNAINVLRQAFETFQQEDLVSDLVAHGDRQAAGGNPADRLWWRLGLAYLHWWNDEKDDALVEVVRATQLAPDDQNLRLELAELYAQRDDLAAALSAAEAVDPLNHELLLMRETLALRLATRTGNVDRARVAAERLFGLRLDADMQIQLSSEMRHLGMHDLAENVLSRARSQAGNRTAALVRLMQRYQADQKTEPALEVAYLLLRQSAPASTRGAAQGRDENSGARSLAMTVLVNSGRLKDLIERVELQLKAAPESIKLHQTLVEYYEAAGNKKQQLESLKRIGELRPDDPRLRLQIGQQIAAAGKAADSIEYYRAAILAEPALLSRHFQNVMGTFQHAKKIDELLALLDEIDLTHVDRFQAVLHIIQTIYNQEKHRAAALGLFRKAWRKYPEQRLSMLQAFQNDDVLRMSEVYEFSRDAVIPRDGAALDDPWTGLDQVNNRWGNDNARAAALVRLVEMALKQNRLGELRVSVEQALAKQPQWQGGRALLAVIHARNHRPELAVPLIQELLADGQNPMPAAICSILAQEIENYGATRQWAFALYESRFNREDAFDDFNWDLFGRLMAKYRAQGQSAKGRELILKLSRMPPDSDDDSPAALALHRFQMAFFIGYALGQFGYPLDAVRVFRDLFDDEDLLRRVQQSDEAGSLQRILHVYANSLEVLARQDPRQALAALLEPRPAPDLAQPAPPRPATPLNLLVTVDRPGRNRRELKSLLTAALERVAASPELHADLLSRVATLAEQKPDDLGVAILAVLAARQDDPPEALRQAIERLDRLVERTPLEELPAGKKANSRQRLLAARQVPLWLAARDCLKLPERRSLGVKLATRALEAARRQADEELAQTILREWGQIALDQGDAETATARWTDLVEQILGRAGKSQAPSPTAGQGAAATNRDTQQPAVVAPTTVSQFNEVVEIATLAGRNGLSDLSFLAMRKALAGGPPVSNNGNNARGQIARAGLRRGTGLSVVDDSDGEQAVETALSELVPLWNRKQAPPEGQYAALVAAAFPDSRPAEIFLCPEPLASTDFRQPKYVGRRLAAAAIQTGRTDDLRTRISARMKQPLAVVPALVLEAQLAVETGDAQASQAALAALLENMQSDLLHHSAELSCLVALPLLDHERLAETAFKILELAAQRLAVAPGQHSAPCDQLFMTLARRQLDRQNADGAKQQFDRLLEFTRRNEHNNHAGWQAHDPSSQWQRIADEYARRGWPGQALDSLGQFTDLPVAGPSNYADFGESLFLLSQAVARLSPERRYKLLKSWTMPAADRQVVRVLAGFAESNDSPAAFRPLAFWNRESFGRVTGSAQRLSAGAAKSGAEPGRNTTGTKDREISRIISTVQLLIDAARETNKLEELSQELTDAARGDVKNAHAVSLIVQLASASPPAVREELQKVIADFANRHPARDALREAADDADDEPVEEDASARNPCLDFLLAQAVLRHPEFCDLGEQHLRQLMSPEAQALRGTVPAYRLRQELAAWQSRRDPKATLQPGTEPGLAFWHDSTDSTGGTVDGAAIPAWVAHERHAARTTAGQSEFLYFDFPLTGECEFSIDALAAGDGRAGVGYCGIVFDALSGKSLNGPMSLGRFRGNGWARRFRARNQDSSATVWPIQRHEQLECFNVLERQDDFNRLSLVVSGAGARFLVNGHLVHEMKNRPLVSPFLSLYAGGSGQVTFRNPSLRGNIRIPREVQLARDDQLEGWIALAPKEGQSQRLTKLAQAAAARARGNAAYFGLDLDALNNLDDGEDPDLLAWSAREGTIRARPPDEAGGHGLSQSLLRLHRPLRNGESLRYEFLYEPGRMEVHPTLGRLTFLLDRDGVRLHWLTERPIPDQDEPDSWTGLTSDNVADEPQCRRGPKVLPLEAGQWNSLLLKLADDTAVLELNGIEIYRRPIEPSTGRSFAFFRDAHRVGCQVRSVVLAGNWPATISPEQMSDLLLPQVGPATLPATKVHHSLIGEDVLVRNWKHVPQFATTLSPQERYAALAEWVLPGSDHATFRLQGGWTQTSPPPIAAQVQRTLDRRDGPRQAGGGELVAPAIDLVELAAQLQKLDELSALASRAAAETEYEHRGKLAFQVLIATARGDAGAAAAHLQQLRQMLDKLPAGTPEFERWPELLAAAAALRDRNLARAALDLLDRLAAQLEPKGISPGWDAAVYVVRDRANLIAAQGNAVASRAPRQWSVVSLHTAQSRGQGTATGQWLASRGAVQHSAGHEREFLYFQSPLLENFEVEGRLSNVRSHPMQVGYADTWIRLLASRAKCDIAHFGLPTTEGVIEPALPALGDEFGFRMVVRDGNQTVSINGVKVHEQLIAANCDPWLFLSSEPAVGGTANNVRITGKPVIPEELDLLVNSDLAGWMADYFAEAAGNWKKEGDELLGGNVSEEESTDEILDDGRPTERAGNHSQCLLRYHRPLLEDGQLEYEFYYHPEKFHVHPALDRLTFILEPAGVRVHWLTDAQYERTQYDRTNLDHENVADEPAYRRGPEKLPLRERDWNKMTLALHGDKATLWLNGVEIYERPLDAGNERIFGLFHYAGETGVRVRKMTYRGSWPRTLPSLADQELAAP